MKMTKNSKDGCAPHGCLPAWQRMCKAGKMDRREFIATASVFGASAATSYGLLGLDGPCR